MLGAYFRRNLGAQSVWLAYVRGCDVSSALWGTALIIKEGVGRTKEQVAGRRILSLNGSRFKQTGTDNSLLLVRLLLGGGALVLLVLGDEVVHVGLGLGEHHLVHTLTCTRGGSPYGGAGW